MLFLEALNSAVFQAGAKLYVTAIACLAYGLAQYNEMVRCTVAHSGNDHRLGAQEMEMGRIGMGMGLGALSLKVSDPFFYIPVSPVNKGCQRIV